VSTALEVSLSLAQSSPSSSNGCSKTCGFRDCATRTNEWRRRGTDTGRCGSMQELSVVEEFVDELMGGIMNLTCFVMGDLDAVDLVDGVGGMKSFALVAVAIALFLAMVGTRAQGRCSRVAFFAVWWCSSCSDDGTLISLGVSFALTLLAIGTTAGFFTDTRLCEVPIASGSLGRTFRRIVTVHISRHNTPRRKL